MDRQDPILVRRLSRRCGARLGLLAILIALTACAPAEPATRDRPLLVLWAWDRPEDLRFLDPAIHAVAAFEALVTLDTDHRVRTRPRLHSLRVPEGMMIEGVVRVEVPTATALDDDVRLAMVAAILAYHRADRTTGIQIDFDARQSERIFYAALLRDLRQRLAPEQTLTITALTAWCVGDRWLDDLPIDDAIPMLFRMGVDDQNLRAYFAAGGDLRSAICRQSVGLSTDEPWPSLPSERRRYVFNPRSWRRQDMAALGQRHRVRGGCGASGLRVTLPLARCGPLAGPPVQPLPALGQ